MAELCEGEGGFRSGRFCIDQTFVLKQLAGKYRKKRKELYADRVVRQVNEKATGIWVKLRDRNGGGRKSKMYYLQMTQCWWQKQ